MRYAIIGRIVDTEEEELRLFRIVLAWAARRSDRFELRFDANVYADSEEVERLRRLGTATDAPTAEPRGLLDKVAKAFTPEERLVTIVGDVSDELVDVLSSLPVPPGTIGAQCPVEEVRLFAGDREIYVVQENGAVQVLTLDEDELRDLRELLGAEGYDQDVLQNAPTIGSLFGGKSSGG